MGIMKKKFPTQDMHSEELSDQNEDFSLVNKGRTSDVEEARRPQNKTKCDCRKRFLTTLISLILVVLVCILIFEIKSRYQLEEQLTTLLSRQANQTSLNPKIGSHGHSIVSSRCCLSLMISSEAETAQMYPNVLGTYNMDRRSIYKNTNRNIYLSKPSSQLTQSASFTWGVNSSPGQTWGWVRAVRDQECPEQVEQWAVYDQEGRGWIRDKTLKIRCALSG